MLKKLRYLLIFLILIIFISCEKQPKKVQNDRATLHQDQEDAELLRIAENARSTLLEFFHHLLRPAKGEKKFMVKYPFKADSNSGFNMEQIWLSDIQYKDGVYYGIAANTPFYISAIKKGDRVSFSIEDISDWMYISGKKIVGAASCKYLLEQISEHNEEQQKIFEMLRD